MFRYSFKILPDRLKLKRLYLCGSLGQSISFVFGARVGHFAATPQSDVVAKWSRDLGVMATLSVRQKMPFFRAFITLKSQFHLLSELYWKSCQKSPLTLDLFFNRARVLTVTATRVQWHHCVRSDFAQRKKKKGTARFEQFRSGLSFYELEAICHQSPTKLPQVSLT